MALALLAAVGLPMVFGVGAYRLSAGSLATGETLARVSQKAIGEPRPAPSGRGSRPDLQAAGAAGESHEAGGGGDLNPPASDPSLPGGEAGSGGVTPGGGSSGPGSGASEDSGSGSDDSGSDSSGGSDDSGSGNSGSDNSGLGSDDSGSDDSGSDNSGSGGGGDD